MRNEVRIARQKMIVCMEYIARCINDEGVFEGWLMCGVPDGEIEPGNLDPAQIYEEDWLITDGFAETMRCFLRRMVAAYNNGGLYCGNVVSGDKEDDKR